LPKAADLIRAMTAQESEVGRGAAKARSAHRVFEELSGSSTGVSPSARPSPRRSSRSRNDQSPHTHASP
jgi:hypothetical protein